MSSFSLTLTVTLQIVWLALTQTVTGPLAQCCALIGECIAANNLSLVRYKLHDLMALLEVRHRIEPAHWEPELTALGEAGCARLAEACSILESALQPALAHADTQPPPIGRVIAAPETLAALRVAADGVSASVGAVDLVAPVPSAFSLASGVPVSTHYRPLMRSLQKLAHHLGYRGEVRVETQRDQTRLTLEPSRVDVAPLRVAAQEQDADRAIGQRLMVVAATVCAGAFRRAECELTNAQSISQMLTIATREAHATAGVLPC